MLTLFVSVFEAQTLSEAPQFCFLLLANNRDGFEGIQSTHITVKQWVSFDDQLETGVQK